MVATLFSLAGFINGLLARNFDDIMIVPTFILTPLSYLGGVFYSIQMLPSNYQFILRLDPIFYMINLLRHGMINIQETAIINSYIIIIILIFVFTYMGVYFLKNGTGLRE